MRHSSSLPDISRLAISSPHDQRWDTLPLDDRSEAESHDSLLSALELFEPPYESNRSPTEKLPKKRASREGTTAGQSLVAEDGYGDDEKGPEETRRKSFSRVDIDVGTWVRSLRDVGDDWDAQSSASSTGTDSSYATVIRDFDDVHCGHWVDAPMQDPVYSYGMYKTDEELAEEERILKGKEVTSSEDLSQYHDDGGKQVKWQKRAMKAVRSCISARRSSKA